MDLCRETERGTQTSAAQLSAIQAAVDDLAQQGAGSVTTGPDLSATWRLVWTTEKAGRRRGAGRLAAASWHFSLASRAAGRGNRRGCAPASGCRRRCGF